MTVDVHDREQDIRVFRCGGCGALAVVEDDVDPELSRWYRMAA